MTIRERSTYDAPPEVLWPFLVRSDLFVQWNTKLEIFGFQGSFQEGMTFGSEYTLGAKRTSCSSTVFRLRENELLHLTHRNCVSEKATGEMEVDETFTLLPRGSRTVLKHKVWLRNHGIPFYFVFLIALIGFFGKPVGPDELKLQLEKDRSIRL